MARPPKPWWNSDRGEYNVNIRGERHRLGPDKDQAERKFHELMAKPPEEPVKAESVAAIMDLFLADCDGECALETYKWYQKHCQAFLDYLKANGKKALLVTELKPHHVKSFIASKKSWSSGTRNGACRAIQRAFSWATQMGHIEQNPVSFIPKKPKPGRRENVITSEEFVILLSHVKDECFRDLLIVSWQCGCRPQESLRVEHRHVDEKNRRWTFPADEAKGKKKVRFVYLTDDALAITKRLMVKHPEGPLFRNREGNPWTPFSINCRLVRLKEKIGRKIALYDFRHSFTERLRKAGIDSVNIAALLGHSDLSMLGRTYAHPHTSPASLLQELKKGS